MSLTDAEAVVPNLIDVDVETVKVEAVDVEANADADADVREKDEATEEPESKDFVDIVEYHKVGPEGREIQIIPADQFEPNQRTKDTKEKRSTYKDYTLVLRRVWVQKNKTSSLVRAELEIQSEVLCRALRDMMVKTYEGFDPQSFPIKMKSPFAELFFYRKEIRALAEDDSLDPQLHKDANVLLKFMKTNGLVSSIVHDYDKYVGQGKIPSEILWTIFRPNSLVVLNVGELKECWICRDVTINSTPLGYYWMVTGLRIAYSGFKVGLVRRWHRLPLHDKELCNIADLAVVPIEHYREAAELKRTLASRAAKVQKILGQDLGAFSSQTYNGTSWSHEFLGGSFMVPPVPVKQIEERVIVDYGAYITRHNRAPIILEDLKSKLGRGTAKARKLPRGMVIENSRSRGRRNRKNDSSSSSGSSSDSDSSSDSESDSELSGLDTPDVDPEENIDIMEFRTFGSLQDADNGPEPYPDTLGGLSKAVYEIFKVSNEGFKLLFPALVPVFGLKSKEWRWVLVDLLRDVKWNSVAFESLQLEAGTKDLIQALVKGHKTKASFDDVMPGKGQGLIFLLHGKPGLGKTLTAESVADYLERPLYTIDGGELSTVAGILEKKLDDIFNLTRKWDAVCLLDEADVLLCKRKSSEMDRNAVVAVFLRKIEYFQGVLFLTTNRRQDFDEAFKSRIHLTISYPDLSEGSQSAIWRKLIETNKSVVVDKSWVDDAFVALGKLGLNGRTIRNFLRTAVSYAHARDESLGVRHVLEIIRTELKGDGFNVLSMKPDEHQKRARADEALRDLQHLVEFSQRN